MYKLSKTSIDAAKFRVRKHAFDVLKDIDTLGTYDFFNTIISLDSIEKREIENLIHLLQIGNSTRDSFYEISKKIIPLTYHEYKHFTDSTSTLWGLHHLKLMQDAYSVNYDSSAETNNFHRAKIFFDHISRIGLPEYYTVITENDISNDIAIQRNTIGLLFNKDGLLSNKPVIFSRYYDSDNNFLARSPVSILSLLEASAMAQEIEAQNKLISSISDENSKLLYQREFRDNLHKYYNNKKLTEYSVCPRFIQLKYPDLSIEDAYLIAEKIIRTALNFSSKSFSQVERLFPFNKVLSGSSHEERRRIINAIKNKDRAVLFYLICLLLPTNDKNIKTNIDEVIRKTIKYLMVSDDYLVDAIEESEKILKSITLGKLDTIKTIGISGLENLTKTINTQRPIDFYELDLPPCILSDLTEWSPFIKSTKKNNLSCEQIFNSLFPQESKVKIFSAACNI